MKKILFAFVILVIATCANATYYLGSITTPNSTVAVNVFGNKNHVFQYTITGINTSVAVKAEGTVDGTNFFNIDANEAVTTQTADGTYALYIDNLPLAQVKFTMTAEVGGTTATIDVKYMGSY